MRVVILSEFFQFSLQIIGIPEEDMVKEFAAQGFDQSNKAVDTCVALAGDEISTTLKAGYYGRSLDAARIENQWPEAEQASIEC